MILREGLDSVLELLLGEGEEQLVHVVDAVLEVGDGDDEAVARGEQVHSRDLVSEPVDEGLQEGQLVLLADVRLPLGDQRTRVARNEVHSRDQARVYYPLRLLLWDPLGLQQPDRLAEDPEPEFLLKQLY